MGLLGNRSRLTFGCNKVWGIAPALTEGARRQSERANWIRQCCATAVLTLTAKPNGYYSPATYQMALVAGEMSTKAFTIMGSGAVSAGNLAGGLNGVAPLTGAGVVSSAAGTMVINGAAALGGSGSLVADVTGKLEAVAALLGMGEVTTANLAGVLSMTSDLAGTGDVTAANLVGVLEAVAAITGTGDITLGNLSGAINAIASVSGTGSLTADVIGAWFMVAGLSGAATTDADISALGNIVAALVGSGVLVVSIAAQAGMSADLVVTGDLLSTANVGDAVMAAIVEAGLSLKDVQRLLLAVSAGKTVIDVGSPTHVRFRDQADTTDRVDAEMDGSERTAVTLDPT